VIFQKREIEVEEVRERRERLMRERVKGTLRFRGYYEMYFEFYDRWGYRSTN
jgi:hypothetical protein